MDARILHNVLKVVKRHMSSSSVMALINAGDREFDITMLEKRLSNSRSSIIVSGWMACCELIAHFGNLALLGF